MNQGLLAGLVPWIPLGVALLTLVGGLAIYGNQKRVDRRFALGDLRRAAYQELLITLQRHLHTNSPATLTDLSAARAKAFVVASDPVAKATGRFFALVVKDGRTSPPNGNDVMEAYATMVVAMRRDSFEKTSLSTSEVIAAAPVVWGEESMTK